MAKREAYHLKISEMNCIQCEHRIAKALQDIQGIYNINVSYKKAKAEFESNCPVAYDNIVNAIENEGYKVEGMADSGFPVKGGLSLAAIILLPQLNLANNTCQIENFSASENLEIRQYSCGFLP